MHFPIFSNVFNLMSPENSSTCDRNNVQQPPHGLWTDVTEPVLSNQQLGQIEGHLPGDGPLNVPTAVCVLGRKWKIMEKRKCLMLKFSLESRHVTCCGLPLNLVYS